MIISHRHRFVYVQVPQTGSTALGDWMIEHLDGLDVLRKHTTLAEARRVLGVHIEGYLVVASVRDSIDQFVSSFYKIVRDREAEGVEPGRSASRAARTSWASSGAPTLDDYVTTFVRRVHAPAWVACIRRADLVIRYEQFDADVGEMARRLGVTDVPPVPVMNTTPRPDHNAAELLTPQNLARLRRYHRPFRSEFHYTDEKPRIDDTLRYEVVLRLKAVRRRRNDSLLRAKVARAGRSWERP